MSSLSKSFAVVLFTLSLTIGANSGWATQPGSESDDGLISRLVDGAKQASDLSFPSSATSKPDGYRSLVNGLFKPDGSGPFPALVVLHDCGGVADYLQALATRALGEGYVVFIPNSLRGARHNCFRDNKLVPTGRRVKDALDAAKSLAALPYVNPKRIFAIGFSQGGTISNLIVSNSVAAVLSPEGPRFAAAISNYPACKVEGGPAIRPDSDRPLLVLLGAKDKETPPEWCDEPIKQARVNGASVETVVFPDATHAWDQPEQSGHTKRDWKGDIITNFYDEATTSESRQKAFSFLKGK